MQKSLNYKFILSVAILGVLLGILAALAGRQIFEADTNKGLANPDFPSALADYQFKDLNEVTRSSSEWQDKVLVLNFWATWCPPCIKEIPTFVELQRQYGDKGVQFVGIAIDDLESTKNFVGSHAVNYPILLGDQAAIELARDMGNRFDGLPFTLVAKPGGAIALRHLGELSRQKLEQLLVQLTDQRN